MGLLVVPVRAQQVISSTPGLTAAIPANQDPAQTPYPLAVPLHQESGDRIDIDSNTQSEHGRIFVLDGAVDIHYGDREVRADHIEYDANTGEVTAVGHLVLVGGRNRERIEASHGTFNLKSETGRFFDVHGSVGLEPQRAATVRRVYENDAPFLFAGAMVVKTGPEAYDIYQGSVTSCQLVQPDWLLTAAHFKVQDQVARGYGSVFRLLNVPVLYLPYVTHPTDPETRETGFMIPSVGESSTRGFTLTEQFYIALNRSMDLLIGASYYSSIGWAQDATYRYRGAGLDFVKFRYTGVVDRRPAALNQGGQDVLVTLRRDLSSTTRIAGDVEYLSSYIYREAFTDNFNQAVTSDVVSRAYIVRESDGMELAGMVDRYQGIKVVQTPQQQVHILHVPSVLVDTTDHSVGNSALQITLDASLSGLKRTQPNFASGGVVERVDLHPQAALPFSLGEWRFRPSVELEETAYSRSLNPPSAGVAATQNQAPLARSAVHFEFGARSPVLERIFQPNRFQGILGSALKHTIEADAVYRMTKGVNRFRDVLRFDPLDVVANTSEIEYGLTQRVFRRRAASKDCVLQGAPSPAASLPDAPDESQMEGGLNPDPTLSVGNSSGVDASSETCQTDELISWRVAQKYFFDPNFGGAIVNRRRNIFDTTLNFSGVAFLTEPRNISPLISRLRVRASAHTDVEWDFDYDTGAKKFTSSNVYLDLHATDGIFGALSYARLDAPGRFYTESVTTSSTSGVTTAVSDFNQLRLLLGFGSPARRGLSLAANTGLDLKSLYGATGTETAATGTVNTTTVYPALLQYATLEANYNWNCCGLSVEYRKFELGSVRNDGSFRFNFTLANVGTAGNLRRSERLF